MEQDPRYGECQHKFAPGGLTCTECFRTFTPFEVKRIKDGQLGFRVLGPDGEVLTHDQAIDLAEDVPANRKVIDEAVFRYEEVMRLSKELSDAAHAWQEWIDAMDSEECKEYYRLTGTRPPRTPK